MYRLVLGWMAAAIICWPAAVVGQEKVELDVTTIRGNKEQPQILYVVPWKEEKKLESKHEHKIVLNSLFGDLFDPVSPQQHGAAPFGNDSP